MDQRCKEILDFWFGHLESEDEYPGEKVHMWFSGTDEINSLIRERFSGDVDLAAAGSLEHWKKSPLECLALVILLDQFTRNMHSNARAFEHDAKALQTAEEAVDAGYDRKVFPLQRCFFYLPFEHSEELEVQEKSVGLFKRLVEEAPPAIELPLGVMLDYAVRHHQIIKRFGRFPHRNKMLGRKSTQEEIEFLKEPGSSF